MSEEELAHEGVLRNHAAKVLMRCLWLSRLARPNLSFAAQRLASQITRWTLWEDRQMLSLISYAHSTADHMIQAKVDPNESPALVVYTDSDFASCPHTAKSTSGVVYILKTGDARYPLLWSSKKQSSTARSTTEAKLIACASALFGEVLNLHTMIESLVVMHVPIVFEQDNQAAIAVMTTGYSAKLRPCGRIHRVNAAPIHEQLEQEILTLRYCETSTQAANGLTKIITPAEWQETLEQFCPKPR